MSQSVKHHLAALLTLALTFTSCGAAVSPAGAAPAPSPRPGDHLQAEPWTVKGTALDARGKPLQNTIVWILPGVTDGLVKATTDAGGHYKTPHLIDMPYNAYAWQRVAYRGQTFCLRLTAETPDQYAAFSPRDGVIRNFRWQLTGAMPDADTDHANFGAEVRLMNGSWDGTSPLTRDSQVEVTLTPDGPLIDGSAGHTIVKTVSFYDGFLYDLPVGHYAVQAAEVQPDGTRTPLVLNGGSGAARFQGSLDFKAEDGTCGGYGGSNGIERAFIDLARP